MNNNSMHFITIYNQYKVLVYNVALNYVQNIEDAEEITQDVFVKVSENVSYFRENSTFKTWIYRISINQSLDFIKKKNSKKRFFVFGRKSENEHELLNSSNFEHPGILLEKQEDAKILFQVINSLPENQKTAFRISFNSETGSKRISAL